MDCPVATMNVSDIITEVMNSFKNSNQNKSIQNLYRFTSLRQKKIIGSYPKFRSIIINKYNYLLNISKWLIKNKKYISKNECLVELIISKNNEIFNFDFFLVKQYDFINNQPLYDNYSKQCLNKYWRIDDILNTTPIIETFEQSKNINDQPLEICSINPKTGFYRDGYCNTGENDYGTHTVCAKMTKEFLDYTKSKGNDLSTPSPELNFPGLKPNNYWCLCALRYKQAKDAGINLDVKKKATHKKTLQYTDI